MARKRTHSEAAKTKVVSVRMREDTYDRVSAAAEQAGMARAAYVESLIENRSVTVAAAEVFPVGFINELKRVGNNLNQITHNMHCKLPPEEGALVKVMAEILRTLAEAETVRRRLAMTTPESADPDFSDDEKAAWRAMRRNDGSGKGNTNKYFDAIRVVDPDLARLLAPFDRYAADDDNAGDGRPAPRAVPAGPLARADTGVLEKDHDPATPLREALPESITDLLRPTADKQVQKPLWTGGSDTPPDPATVPVQEAVSGGLPVAPDHFGEAQHQVESSAGYLTPARPASRRLAADMQALLDYAGPDLWPDSIVRTPNRNRCVAVWNTHTPRPNSYIGVGVVYVVPHIWAGDMCFVPDGIVTRSFMPRAKHFLRVLTLGIWPRPTLYRAFQFDAYGNCHVFECSPRQVGMYGRAVHLKWSLFSREILVPYPDPHGDLS